MGSTRWTRLSRLAARRHVRDRAVKNYLPLWILAGAMLIAVLFAVILGNVLGRRADGVLVTPIRTNETETGQIAVPDTVAQYAVFGSTLSDLPAGTETVSVTLRRTDGTLCYTSDVAAYFGRQAADGVSLASGIARLSTAGIRVSAVFCVTSLALSGGAQTAERAIELALLSEIAACGVSEIVLDGISFTGDTDADTAVMAYLETVRTVCPATAVGVMLDVSVMQAQNPRPNLRAYLTGADFLLLDLRIPFDAETWAALLNACAVEICAFPIRLCVGRYDSASAAYLQSGGYTALQFTDDPIS